VGLGFSKCTGGSVEICFGGPSTGDGDGDGGGRVLCAVRCTKRMLSTSIPSPGTEQQSTKRPACGFWPRIYGLWFLAYELQRIKDKG
jgi:hypothetical protein